MEAEMRKALARTGGFDTKNLILAVEFGISWQTI
jgi:hypothetical protein